MKEFTWQDVKDYVDKNLDTYFEYTNPMYPHRKSSCHCLMSSFFADRGIKFERVHFRGFRAEIGCSTVVAVVKDPPLYDIYNIHYCDQHPDIITGEQIKQNIERLGL